MRVAIDYSAAVNQRAGVGRLVRNQVLALAELDRDNDYLLVYARPNRGQVPEFPSSPDFVLPPLRHARGILTVHDLAFLMRPDCADERLRAYLEGVVPRSVQRADFIVADSENTRNDLVVLLGVQPASIAVVPGGVEKRFAPVTDTGQLQRARQQIGVGDAPFVVAIG